MPLQRWKNKLHRYFKKPHISLWYHPDYRLPVPALSRNSKIELRRADYVVWELASLGFLNRDDLKTPTKIPYKYLADVHSPEMLDSLANPDTLSRAFAVADWEIPVDEVLRTIRLACCGTLKAARNAITFQGPSMNLLGGFHHAHIEKPGGLCLVNDIAVAISYLRKKGFDKPINILDLDAHPPDGTADCLYKDPKVWIGSLSGSDWGELPGVDETVLPQNCDDDTYLQALVALLKRQPKAGLTFVIAGGDVLKGDGFGLLGLTLAGARERDLLVARNLHRSPSVWLPGGGYHRDAWRVLAGTVLAAFLHTRSAIPTSYRPLKHHFNQIYYTLDERELQGETDALLTSEDLTDIFGPSSQRTHKFLGYYTAEGIELALFKYGILDELRRMGFQRFKVVIRKTGTGDLVQLKAYAGRLRCILFEMILKKHKTELGELLYIDWFTLRNPKSQFKPDRPKLPGQEVPGLGLAKEAIEIIFIMAKRLCLDGVMFKPSWFHIAFTMRHFFQFQDLERHARFRALIRDMAAHPLLNTTIAISEERVLLNGTPYQWEANDMFYLADKSQHHDPKEIVERSKDYRFTLCEQKEKTP